MIILEDNNSKKIDYKYIDKESNIVILGPATTEQYKGILMQFSSDEEVYKAYGSSILYDAFKYAKLASIKSIFLINTLTPQDYIKAANKLQYHDFVFIVPIGINFSDMFYNKIEKRNMYYCEYFLNRLSNSRSSIIMTDAHASLYYDIDHYINDMMNKIVKVRIKTKTSLVHGNNLYFVGNLLEDYPYANLVLAITLLSTNLNDYPSSTEFGKAVFDIDDFDISEDEFIYFKNNFLIDTSIENFKNFYFKNDAVKIGTVDRVIKYIERNLDFSQYYGRIYTNHIKLSLYKFLNDFLQQLKGTVIKNYQINSIQNRKKNNKEIIKGNLILDFSIVPYNSLETHVVKMEV